MSNDYVPVCVCAPPPQEIDGEPARQSAVNVKESAAEVSEAVRPPSPGCEALPQPSVVISLATWPEGEA